MMRFRSASLTLRSSIITPTIIMRFVGCSMRSQAVSTPEMRSLFVMGSGFG